ncbi:helix-turn-helix domain-containing protein [Microbacterium saperdae]
MSDKSFSVKLVIHIDEKSFTRHAEYMEDKELATRFSDALVSEIKAEMGRQDLSSRGLARLIGATPQFVSSRLDGGNPRTGERVILNIQDIVMIATALGIPSLELITRAENVARRRQDYDLVANDSINEFPAGDDADYDHA